VEWEFCDSEPVLECGPDDITVTLWVYNQERNCNHVASSCETKDTDIDNLPNRRELSAKIQSFAACKRSTYGVEIGNIVITLK
jgi:hypothetical protein